MSLFTAILSLPPLQPGLLGRAPRPARLATHRALRGMRMHQLFPSGVYSLNHYRRRVAANGAAPPGAEAVPRDSAVRPSTRWGCSRTGPDGVGTESSKTPH